MVFSHIYFTPNKLSALLLQSSSPVSAVSSFLVKYKDPPVACVVRAGVVHPYDDKDMLKVRANSFGREGVRARLLEHDGHYVVPNVALSQQLVREKHSSIYKRSVVLEYESILSMRRIPFK